MLRTSLSAFPIQRLLSQTYLKRLGQMGLVALAYFLTARLSLAFVAQPENLAVVWPPSGVMLAALLLHQRRAWPGILVAIFLTNLLANLTAGNTVAVSLGFATANSLEGLVTAWLLFRYLQAPPTFTNLKEVLALAILAAALGNGLTAFLGAAVPALGFGAPYWNVWRVWWVADGLGILLVTPLIVTWVAAGSPVLRNIKPTRALEAVIAFALLVALAQWIFAAAPETWIVILSPPVVIFPLLIWIALRFDQRSVVTALLLLSVIAVWHTIHGLGPFAVVDLPTTLHVVGVQTFLGVTMLSMLALAAAIAERQQAETALRQSEHQTRTILDSAYDAFIAMNSDGLVIDWNRQAEAIFGWTHQQALGQPLAQLIIPSQYMEAHRQGLRHFLTTGEDKVFNQRLELSALHRTGREFPVELTITPNRVGDQYHFAAFLRDISDRKRAEAEIHQLNEELQQRVAELIATNKELEAFSYSVSHDLRAPLRSIDGFSRILLEDYGPQVPAEAQRYLTIVREDTQQMGNLIDGLLTFSRLSRQPVSKQSIRPADLINRVLVDLRAEGENRKVEVKIGELPACQADPTLLKQVFVNLLSNALKFTRAGPTPVIEVGSQERDGECVYFVRDNGTGFDPEYSHKLFGVFQRLHRAEEYEGTGVGLAIVQRIVHRHGGRIWAEGELSKGATFYFTLEGRATDE